MLYSTIIKKHKKMVKFKVIERKFQISNVIELSKGCRVSKIISCVVENLDSGELLKIKSKTASGLEEKIINKIDDFDCECGDILFIEE
jgi:hypothetical protein